MQSALSGDACVAIICCINPTQIEESKRTLDFARRARQVRTNAEINQVALSVPASNRMELMEGAVDTEPKISNTNNELMNKIGALKVELADKDAEIKRLNDDLKSRNAGAFSIFTVQTRGLTQIMMNVGTRGSTTFENTRNRKVIVMSRKAKVRLAGGFNVSDMSIRGR